MAGHIEDALGPSSSAALPPPSQTSNPDGGQMSAMDRLVQEWRQVARDTGAILVTIFEHIGTGSRIWCRQEQVMMVLVWFSYLVLFSTEINSS